MKPGMDLATFAAELTRQNESKRDYKAPSGLLSVSMLPEGAGPQSPEGYKMNYALDMQGVGQLPMRKLFHQQLAERTNVPWNYYQRMQAEAPDLLPTNVNRWLQDSKDVRLVRAIDGQARALLGGTYRPLDNFDLMTAVIPTLMEEESRGLRMESLMITETKFYIKAFTERISGEVRKGDVVQAGVVISNSEVGQGTLSVEPAVFRLVCTNGMVMPDASMKRRHVGRRGVELDGIQEFLTDATRAQDDKAFWMKVLDVVKGTFSDVVFAKMLGRMREAAEDAIPTGGASVQEIVEVTCTKHNLTESEGSMILKNLIQGGDLSRYGLLNAVTATAKEETLSYEKASEFERLGGVILDMPRSEWKELVAA